MHFLDKLLGRKNSTEEDKPLGIPLYIPPSKEEQKRSDQTANEKLNLPVEITKHSDIPQLEMTFQEAQKAGFQFRYRKARRHETTVIITRIHIRDFQLIIPAKINGYEVQRIATKYNVKVDKNVPEVKLYLPDTVKYIEERAFTDCRKLTTVFFPKGHINIGNNAFDWLRNLKELHFGKSAAIGNEAFRYCYGLESVELESCSFGKGAFYGCENLKSVKWQHLNKYGCEDAVFYNTPFEKSQELLILGDVLQKYNGKAKTFIVPDGIITIGDYAFLSCKALEKVVLPNSVSTIGYCAFSGCENLKEINLENVHNIHCSAFSRCLSFGGDIQFHPNVRFHDNPFSSSLLGNEHTTPDGIVINDTLMTMGNNFVDDVWTISEGIRRISCEKQSGFRLFACYGKTVVLPRSMESIEALDCFDHAKSIVIRNCEMSIGSSTNISFGTKDFTLCYETGDGISEFVFYYPKWQKNNPVYDAAYNLYKEFFKNINRHGIYNYDQKILTIGLTYRQMLDIAYRRLTGGFMLHDDNRRLYMDFVRTHRKKGLKYAAEENNEEKTEFFKKLSLR